MQPVPKLECLLDTGPLISLCAFQLAGKPFIDTFLFHAEASISDSVAREALAEPPHRDVRFLRPLLLKGHITTLMPPAEPTIVNVYHKLGQAERDIIRLGLTRPRRVVVLDDFEATMVACRFGLRPVHLLDVLVRLVQQYKLPEQAARDILSEWRAKRRYGVGYLSHTQAKLDEVTAP